MVPYYQRAGGDTMKAHHKHPHSDHSLGGLLDHCGHIFAHRIGDKKRGQDGILSIITQHPGITQKELGEILGIQPASVSELLMKLERKGLVLREKDEQDRRNIRVQITTEAEISAATTTEGKNDPFCALSVEEQEQLRTLLEKLLADWMQRYPAEHHHTHHKHSHKKENHNGKYE